MKYSASLYQRLFAFAILAAVASSASADEDPLPYVSGYAGSWSNPSGQPAQFHLSGIENPNAELHAYDINFNSVASLSAPVVTQQHAAENTKPWENGYGYTPQTIDLPELQSGLYFLDGPELTRNRIPFIVSTPNVPADVVVIYPTNTVNAYSQSENVSLYSKVDGSHPKQVSFHRPQDTLPDNKLFTTQGLDRLLPTMADDISYKYIADSDLESFDAISGSKLVIIPGHSEYWTVAARRNLDRFVEVGGSALVLSGNALFRSVGYDDPENPTALTFSPRVQFTSASADYPTWESIGVDFTHGGNGSGWEAMRERLDNPYDGWKVLDATKSYLADEGVTEGQVIHSPAPEFDGVPYTECDPITGPVVDMEKLGFHQLDLIAFENTSYGGQRPTCAAWIDFRKEEASGRQITVGAMTAALFGRTNASLKRRITQNMIELLLIDQADFDGDESLSTTDLQMLFDEMHEGTPSPRFDLTEDGVVSLEDTDRWLASFVGSTYGDADLDGRVDFDDFLVLARNFSNDEATWSMADFNGDQEVDFQDYLALARNFGFGSSRRPSHTGAVSVPEPSCYSILVCGGVLLAIGYRRKRVA